jgi:hypothetical protein
MNGTKEIEIPESELSAEALSRILLSSQSSYSIGQQMLIHLGPAKKPCHLSLISARREGNGRIILTATLERNQGVVILSYNPMTRRITAQVPTAIANSVGVV